MKQDETYTLKELVNKGWKDANIDYLDMQLFTKRKDRIFVRKMNDGQYKIKGVYRSPIIDM